MASQDGAQPKTIASARHGGDLTDDLAVTDSWLVYLEYQQQGQTSSAAFWFLDAVNWVDGQSRELASATAGPALKELPWYSAADGRAVWNQLDSSGRAMLRSYDFASGVTSTLATPAGMYPVQPAISGGYVAFLNNSADPGRATEDFNGRRGSLQRIDLVTKQVTTLSSDPNAWMPQADSGLVVWTVVSPTSPAVVSVIPMAGGTVRTFASTGNAVTPQTNGSIVLWYDSSNLHFMAYELKRQALVRLQVGNWSDARSVFRLCGNRLFFALPPNSDGGTSTIRYVDLGRLAG